MTTRIVTHALRVAVLLSLGTAVSLTAHAEAKLVWMEKAYGDGQHNAFTDLIRWHDAYFLCFRHGAGHLSMDGEIRVMRSTDMKTWEPCAVLDTFGDDRDPHFVADDSALYCYFGTWDLAHAQNHNLPDRRTVKSCFAKTLDGTVWSKVQSVYEAGWWLWRVRYHEGFLYSGAYQIAWPAMPTGEMRLLRSKDGLEWELVSVVSRENVPDEADLYFPPQGGVWMIARTCGQTGTSRWYRSNPAMTEWQDIDTNTVVHSPVFGMWQDWFVVGGRGKTEAGYVTRFWRISGEKLEEVITLPSGGDTAYPGLVVEPPADGRKTPELLVSWYSQHEVLASPDANKAGASVYVGRVTFE